MSATLIQLFSFMTCTFLLGLFLGWALWRYGGVTKATIEDLEEKAQFWKKSFDQSRIELWNLQEKTGMTPDDVASKSRVSSQRPLSGRSA